MQPEMIIQLTITAICFIMVASYFNHRERKVHHYTERKLSEIKELYIRQTARRRVKERQEIERVKVLVGQLEEKHRKLLEIQKQQGTVTLAKAETEKFLKQAEERAKQLEEEMKKNAAQYIEQQKQEVQLKMVDLVLGVTKKVITKNLNYEDHKELIEQALAEVEQEDLNGQQSK